jgi:hypothetical protein
MRQENIYALVDPGTHCVRYVGRTSQTLEQRLAHHIGAARRGKVASALYAWIRSTNYKPTIVLLQTVEPGEVRLPDGRYENPASAAEIKWVKRFERSQLTNRWIDRECRAYKRLINTPQARASP